MLWGPEWQDNRADAVVRGGEEGHADEDENEEQVHVGYLLHTVLVPEGDTGVTEILLLNESDGGGALMDFLKR